MYNKQYTVTQGLTVQLTITSNPLHLYPKSLFQVAARINKKRQFLFVSPVLGKHLPVNPSIPLLLGRALAYRYTNQTSNDTQIQTILNQPQLQREFQMDVQTFPCIQVDQPVTVIGFCETATALGQSVFDSFSSKAKYIHSTREKLTHKKPTLTFEEEHSHATAHYIYTEDETFFADHSEIILVDDEITTGKTALHIIRKIVQLFPHKKKFTVLSILDWRNDKNRLAYQELEQELAIQIQAVALICGTVTASGQPTSAQDHIVEAQTTTTTHLPQLLAKKINIGFHKLPVEHEPMQPAYLKETGRFGLSNQEQSMLPILTIAEKLARLRAAGPCLVLGTGECMYLPIMIASQMGKDVFFHATTRSPILSLKTNDYPITHKQFFQSIEQPTANNYVYNIPRNYYQDIFILFERVVSTENLINLQQQLATTLDSTIYYLDLSQEEIYQPVGEHI